MFDRGTDVTALLWFIYKLEQEAEIYGGRIHFVLGNHDVMNLYGNVKYVAPKYTALAKKLKLDYKELYGEKSELGKWLRTKNAMVKINKTLFCHAGVSIDLVNNDVSLAQANEKIRNGLGLRKHNIRFFDHTAGILFGRKGPLWYRGHFGDYKSYYKKTTQDEISKILEFYDVNKIVVGHTVVDSIRYLLDEKVIAIDVVNKNDPRKSGKKGLPDYWEALLIDNGKYFKMNTNGETQEL